MICGGKHPVAAIRMLLSAAALPLCARGLLHPLTYLTYPRVSLSVFTFSTSLKYLAKFFR